MKRLLFLLFLTLSMTLIVHGEASAAQQPREDRLQKVEQKEDKHEAMLTDASNVYRICNSRPQRILPTWNFVDSELGNKLPFYHKHYLSLLILHCGLPRSETAPIRSDVANRYYVICLRRLLC